MHWKLHAGQRWEHSSGCIPSDSGSTFVQIRVGGHLHLVAPLSPPDPPFAGRMPHAEPNLRAYRRNDDAYSKLGDATGSKVTTSPDDRPGHRGAGGLPRAWSLVRRRSVHRGARRPRARHDDQDVGGDAIPVLSDTRNHPVRVHRGRTTDRRGDHRPPAGSRTPCRRCGRCDADWLDMRRNGIPRRNRFAGVGLLPCSRLLHRGTRHRLVARVAFRIDQPVWDPEPYRSRPRASTCIQPCASLAWSK
jgi:hypothetical protein